MGQPLIQMDRVPISFLPQQPAMQYWTGSCRIGNRQRPRHNKMEMHYDIRVANSIYAFGGHHFSAICQLELTRDSSGSALLAYIYLSTTHRLTACFSNGIPKSGWRPSSTCLREKNGFVIYLFIFFLSSIQSPVFGTSRSFQWLRKNLHVIRHLKT